MWSVSNIIIYLFILVEKMSFLKSENVKKKKKKGFMLKI